MPLSPTPTVGVGYEELVLWAPSPPLGKALSHSGWERRIRAGQRPGPPPLSPSRTPTRSDSRENRTGYKSSAASTRARFASLLPARPVLPFFCLRAGEYVGRAASAGERPAFRGSPFSPPPSPPQPPGSAGGAGSREAPGAACSPRAARRFAHLGVDTPVGPGGGVNPEANAGSSPLSSTGAEGTDWLGGAGWWWWCSSRAVQEASGMDSETDLRSPLFHVVGVKKLSPVPGRY